MVGCRFIENKKTVQIRLEIKNGPDLECFFNHVFRYTLKHYYHSLKKALAYADGYRGNATFESILLGTR